MTLALFAVVLAVVVVLVGLPLVRPALDQGPASEAPADPAASVDKVLSALNEIEYDFHMNKLSEADYQELHNRYSRKAITLIQELEQNAAHDDAVADAELEAELEAEAEGAIQAALETPLAAGKAPGHKKHRPKATVARAYCQHCGATLLQASQAFCHSCGLPLEEE